MACGCCNKKWISKKTKIFSILPSFSLLAKNFFFKLAYKVELTYKLPNPNPGLWGKLMTGPWMTLVYGDEKKREHLAMSPHFKQALQFCRLIIYIERTHY